MQRAKHNPADVIVELKYHVAWNVAQRKSLFGVGDECAEQLKAGLAAAEIPSLTFAALLWLAPDHIHVYFESDGEASPEVMVKALKDVTSSILTQHPTVGAQLNHGQAVWDEAYFCETVG